MIRNVRSFTRLGRRLARFVAGAAIAILATQHAAEAQGPDPRSEQFFEEKIRPVLVQHCYSCHSEAAQAEKKLQAKLFLDTADGVAAGGESGPAIVKGKAAESLLIKALKYDGVEMPPTGRLPEAVVADFVKWVDAGATDPRQGKRPTIGKREIDVAAGRQFWSFQPLRSPAPPDPATLGPDAASLASPIDRFIRASQVKAGVKPNSPASKERLLRRVYFDLIGLPPTPAQIEAFVRDDSPQAYERVVDELLKSPRYGERWGRHWLDVARFAESGGYEFDGFRPGAYHYRDWVIRALNDDLPYDEFVRMQIAGDLLKPGYEGASAVGFLVAGPFPGQITQKTEERIRYDQLDDMLMTIGGSMLGLTLGCVRCHEHKYDPLPQQDYYALAASLARSSHGPVTLDPDPAATKRAADAHAARREQLLAELRKFAEDKMPAKFTAWQKDELPKLTGEPRWQILQPLEVTASDTWLTTTDEGLVVFTGPRRKDGDTYVVTAQTHQKKLTSVRLDAFTDKSMPKKGPGFGGDGSFALGDLKITAKPLDPQSKEQPVVLKLKAISAAFEETNQSLKNAVDDNPGTFWRANADGGKDNAAILEIDGGFTGFAGGAELKIELRFVSQGLGRFRLAVSTEPGAPTWAGEIVRQDLGEIKAVLADHKNQLTPAARPALVRWFGRFDAETDQVRRAVDEHLRAVPRPQLTEVYTVVGGGRDVFLLRRGEVDNKQGKAEPGYLQVLATSSNGVDKWLPKPAAGQPAVDPRIGLASWLTDAQEGAGPLLARVAANRLWQHHFGEGLVGTPNDFGAQGERPSHPELLEWLASELVRGGWRLKPLHKQLVLSAAYRQDSVVDAANRERDPDNRLFWHHKPKRLEAEAIRDALLSVGDSLDATMYGPSVLDNTSRRSVYLRVKRSELIPLMTMFDAPEPTQSIGERISTTVPTQALAMMNAPFVRQQAERLAKRVRTSLPTTSGQAPNGQAPNGQAPAAPMTNGQAVQQAYLFAFGRQPSDTERRRMSEFLVVAAAPAAASPATTPPAAGTPAAATPGANGSSDPSAAPVTDAALVEFCHALLCLNEFLYVD